MAKSQRSGLAVRQAPIASRLAPTGKWPPPASGFYRRASLAAMAATRVPACRQATASISTNVFSSSSISGMTAVIAYHQAASHVFNR